MKLLVTGGARFIGKNFVRTMLELGQKGVNPSVVSDQVGRMTFTSELVRAISHLLSHEANPSPPTNYRLPTTGTPVPYGTYNVTNDGDSASWADITREIFKEASLVNTVTDVTTAEYYKDKDGVAPRPLQSTLDLSKIKALGFTPHDWREDLKVYISRQSS